MKKILLLLLIVMNYTVSFSQTTEKPKTANEILTKHNFQDNITFLAAENIPLETLLSMWDDTQNALSECVDDAIKMRLNILQRKLIMKINDEGYDLTQRKVKTDKEKKIDEEIAQLDNELQKSKDELQKSKDELQKSKDELQKSKDNIKKITVETEKVKKIIEGLTGEKQN